MFMLCLDYVFWISIDLIKENDFTLKKARNRRYPTESLTDIDYADDVALLTNRPVHAEFQLHSLQQAAGGIDLYVHANKTVLNRKEPFPL